MIDQKTPRLGLPLPNIDNYLEDDVVRLGDALTMLDAKVATVGDDGKIPVSQIPAVALTDTFTVDSEAAMLALSAQPGDIAIRNDLSKSFVLMASPASTVGNWKELVNDALVQLSKPDGYLKVGGLDKQYGNIGNAREQWRRQLADVGLNLIDGSFEEGTTVQSATDAVWHISGGQCYLWSGALPKAVPANSTPDSTGGVSAGSWVVGAGITLKTELLQGSVPAEMGTDALRDSQAIGTLDRLLNSTVPGSVNLQKKKVVLPNGEFSATRWFRNRGVASADPSVTEFELKGQGGRNTILKHPAETGVGDHIYADYVKRSYIGAMTLDNGPLGAGTSQATSKNGQIWLRYAEDTQVDDIVFKGGDVLSYCLDNCKNVLSTNLKVDYQYRYPVGYSKSPLIVGDFSEKCMFVGGYVRSVSPDGSVTYAGDLADNDQANDTKWAFINLLGLPYATRANANACMWQEGEDAPSNAHFFGMNYYGNGIGHGVTQQAVGTDIGCTFRENQVRSVWNTTRYCSIGGHWIDNKGLNAAGVSNSAALGTIHVDNGRWTASLGEYFAGNLRDLQDYTGGEVHAFNSIHLLGNRHGAPISLGSGGNAQHLGVVNCQLIDEATIFSGNSRAHAVISASHIVGALGTFGNGGTATVTDIIGCTLIANGLSTAMVNQSGLGLINFAKCEFKDYTAGLVSGATIPNVTFEKCTFRNVTFTSADLTAKYIACSFINCTNAPNVAGLNFAADSFSLPSSARCEVTVAAGGTYTFPSWILETRGVYTIKIGGRGTDIHCAEFRISKGTASNTGTVTALFESTAGKFSISWAGGTRPTITFVDAGTYTVKVG